MEQMKEPKRLYSGAKQDGGPDFGQPRDHLAEILDKVKLIKKLISEKHRVKKILARAKAIKGVDLARMSDEELLKKIETGELGSASYPVFYSPVLDVSKANKLPKGKDLAKLSDEEFLRRTGG